MGKHRHTKDRMFVSYTEHKNGEGGGERLETAVLTSMTSRLLTYLLCCIAEWGGKKDAAKVPLSKLPFNCCSLSMTPFKNPVCSPDGIVFDIMYCFTCTIITDSHLFFPSLEVSSLTWRSSRRTQWQEMIWKLVSWSNWTSLATTPGSSKILSPSKSSLTTLISSR